MQEITWLAEEFLAWLGICPVELLLNSAIVLRHFQICYFSDMH
jgi:hypothetical protein